MGKDKQKMSLKEYNKRYGLTTKHEPLQTPTKPNRQKSKIPATKKRRVKNDEIQNKNTRKTDDPKHPPN